MKSIAITFPKEKWIPELKKSKIETISNQNSNTTFTPPTLKNSMSENDYILILSMAQPLHLTLVSPFIPYPFFVFELFNDISPKLIVKKSKKIVLRPTLETDIQFLSHFPLRYNEMIWKFEFLREFLEQDKLTFLALSAFPVHVYQAFYLYRLNHILIKKKKLEDKLTGFEIDEFKKTPEYFFEKKLFIMEIKFTWKDSID